MATVEELEAASNLSPEEIAYRRSISMPVVFQTDEDGNVLSKIKTTNPKFYNDKSDYAQVDEPYNVDGYRDRIDLKTGEILKNVKTVESYSYPAEPEVGIKVGK